MRMCDSPPYKEAGAKWPPIATTNCNNFRHSSFVPRLACPVVGCQPTTEQTKRAAQSIAFAHFVVSETAAKLPTRDAAKNDE